VKLFCLIVAVLIGCVVADQHLTGSYTFSQSHTYHLGPIYVCHLSTQPRLRWVLKFAEIRSFLRVREGVWGIGVSSVIIIKGGSCLCTPVSCLCPPLAPSVMHGRGPRPRRLTPRPLYRHVAPIHLPSPPGPHGPTVQPAGEGVSISTVPSVHGTLL